MTFQDTIKRLMAEKGWESAHLAAALSDKGLKITTWSVDRWLTGHCEPRLSTARVVAEVFGITLDALYPPAPPAESEPEPAANPAA